MTLDKTKFSPIDYHRVTFGMGSTSGKGKNRTRTYEVVKFDVADGWVSFHHSLYWLLAELYKSTHLLSEEQFRSEFDGTEFRAYQSLRDVVLRCAGGEKGVLALLDYPLRGMCRPDKPCLIRC
jgi:E3 ubiquitin-protein ligase UBR1